ncbi:MAG TPA: hypothetical protein VFP54_06125 [Acidimicrobiales bacterium]|nr:hypothetical protein [Acidimicrobiales bacterium]
MNVWLDPPTWIGDAGYRALSWLSSERGQHRLRQLVWVLTVLSLLGFLLAGANIVARPYLTHHLLPGYPGPPLTSHP